MRKKIPVGAELQRATESGQHGESTVPVNPFFDLGGLGPGVWVQQPMAVQHDAGFYKAKPKRLGFSAEQQVISRSGGLMFCQPVCGLIDAYHQRVRMRFRNERRAHASAAERIEDQGSLLALKPVEQLRERSPRMRGAGFAPWVPLVVLDNLFEVWVRSQLVRCECRRSEVRLICLRRDSHLAIIPRYPSLSGQY